MKWSKNYMRIQRDVWREIVARNMFSKHRLSLRLHDKLKKMDWAHDCYYCERIRKNSYGDHDRCKGCPLAEALPGSIKGQFCVQPFYDWLEGDITGAEKILEVIEAHCKKLGITDPTPEAGEEEGLN